MGLLTEAMLVRLEWEINDDNCNLGTLMYHLIIILSVPMYIYNSFAGFT